MFISDKPHASKVFDEEEECKEFIDKTVTEWKKNPNNYIYDYEEDITQITKTEPAEYHIYKRRQKTKDGKENPASPCDDKGLPLYVDREGTIITKSNGNAPLWGEWVDGTKEGVSLDTVTIPRDRCYPNRIKRRGYLMYPDSEEEAEIMINKDQAMHDKQQARRKNKVQVAYDIRKEKEETSYPQWQCIANGKKTREYPENWSDPKYDPRRAALYPIEIHLKWKKQKDGKWITTGAGNFRGKKRLKEGVDKGELFGTHAITENLRVGEFTKKPVSQWESSSERQMGDYIFKVPNTDDYCVVSLRWSGYYDPSFAYSATMSRLGIDLSEGMPLGHNEFRWAEFSLEKGVKTGKKLFGIVKKREDPTEEDEYGEFDELKFYKYKEKAPDSSVKACHEKFNKLVWNSMIELSDEVPKVY